MLYSLGSGSYWHEPVIPQCIMLPSMVVVLVVMTSPSSNAYMGRQMPRRDEEFQQVWVILKPSETSIDSLKWHWRSASHFGHDRSRCFAVSFRLPLCGQVGDVIRPMKALLTCLTSVGGLRFVPGMEYMKATLCWIEYDSISDAISHYRLVCIVLSP